MDKKDQKPLTIGDILDELTKPSVIRTPETSGPSRSPAPLNTPPPPSQSRTPSLSTVPPSQKSEVSSGFNLPSLGKKEEDKTSISSPQPSELSLSIRTMSADLDRLKIGRRPTGFEFQKPVSRPVAIPTPEMEKGIPKPPPIRPLASIPSIPPMPPPAPKSPPLSGRDESHKHSERVISNDSLPSFPGAPVPKNQPLKMSEEKVEYRTIAKVIGKGMTTGIVSTVIVAILIYLLIYFLILKKEEDLVLTPTPTPVQETEAPVINELENIFRSIQSVNFSVPQNREEVMASLRSLITQQTLAEKEFRRINLVSSANNTDKTFIGLLRLLAVNYPTEIEALVKNDNMLLMYGQNDTAGHNTTQISKGLVLIVETENPQALLEAMKRWEATIADDLRTLFDVDPSRQASQAFLDNQFGGTNIRYKNFPLPDKSIDYAIVSSLAGKYYLVLTNSRESMYSPTEKIKGL